MMTSSIFHIMYPPSIPLCRSRPEPLSSPPFAALSGHGDAIREAGRETDAWVEIGEDAEEQLTRKLQMLQEGVMVRFVYFSPDNRKQGGAYLVQEGRVKRIDETERKIVLYGGKEVMIDRIFEVEILQTDKVE